MLTYLEQEWQEDRNVRTLFPVVHSIASSNPLAAFKTVKQNKKYGNSTLAEIMDAAWWCLFGMLYSDEDDRTNSLPHDDYFYKEDNFKKDAEMMCKCEMMRLESGVHRYTVPKRGNNQASKKKIRRFNDYRDFMLTTTMGLISNDVPSEMREPEVFKMAIDGVRCSQERVLGNEPDDVNEARKEQFVAIGNFIDDVFVHRGYCKKVEEEGAEMLTPEQVEEWETARERIKHHSSDVNNTIPGFVRAMVNQEWFIDKSIA